MKNFSTEPATLALAIAVGLAMGGCEKARLDEQVRELCAKDGGIKVYETVELPESAFDGAGVPNMLREREEIKAPGQHDDSRNTMSFALGNEYLLKWETTYLQSGNPSLRRDRYLVMRRQGGEPLGEAISYARRGGDIPGPWHESSFRCPEQANEVALTQRVFVHSK